MNHPADLFGYRPADDAAPENTAETQQKQLGQYPTPLWLAEAIVERYFPHLDGNDLVLEPSCGPGHFLRAIPSNIPAVGIEIDPIAARTAQDSTKRRIIVGDFRTVELDFQPTCIISNPKFEVQLCEALLERAHRWLPDNGRMGLILPAYMFQTAQRVAGYAERWSIAADMIPRNVYNGLSEPLTFALFSKDKRRTMIGLAFYNEAAAVQSIDKRFRDLLERSPGPLWRSVITAAIDCLGGEADLQAIYELIERRRPTRTPFWREKIRQVCQQQFTRTARGRYAIPETNAA